MEKTSRAVIVAIAEIEGVDPIDLPPLYWTIDTDKLDKLVRDDQSVEVRFEYQGHDVIATRETIQLNGKEMDVEEVI